MAQDVLETNVPQTAVPEEEKPKPGLWKRIQTRWFGGDENGRSEGADDATDTLQAVDEVTVVETKEKQPPLHEFLTHKFFSSVQALEHEAEQVEGVAEKLEADAYVDLRKAQTKDRSEEYAELPPVDSYVILSDVPTDEEKTLVTALLEKDITDMDYAEAVYWQGLFNPGFRDGGDILSLLARRIAAKGRRDKVLLASPERKRGLEISRKRTDIGSRINFYRTKGLDFGYDDHTYEALMAKDELIERVRDGKYE